MALFFDIRKLEQLSGSSSHTFVSTLRKYWETKHVKMSMTSLHGNSFMLNPSPLFHLKDVDIGYIVQYIKLAALRDFAMYSLSGQVSLDLSFFPDINLKAIASNPLLKIVNNQIQFKYEEIYHGKSIRRYQRQSS